MGQVEIELRFELLPIEGFDLGGDLSPLANGFFRDLHQAVPFQAGQIGSLYVEQHQRSPRADILALCAFSQFVRFDQIAGVAKIVNTLIGDHAAGESRLVFTQQPAADEEAGVAHAGACDRVGVGINLRIVQGPCLLGARFGGLQVCRAFEEHGMVFDREFHGLLYTEKTAMG